MVDAPKSLSSMLAERTGRENIKSTSRWGKLLKEAGVSKSSEFVRVLNLPARDWETAANLEKLIDALTEALKTPQGTMRL